jgi:penicillin-binding protein 2
MAAVFANKGALVNPYIVRAVAGQDITAHQRKSTKVAVKENTLNYIRQGMRQVVVDPKGTAKILADLKVEVAGKTGTAQVPQGNSHAWFVGFFPFKKPQFVICIFLEHGVHGYACAVLTRQIIEAMLKEGLINEKL